MSTPIQVEIFQTHIKEPGIAIDVGANDGLFLSNTYALEKQGWRVLCVEPNPYYGAALWANRKEHVIAAAGETCGEELFYLTKSENNVYASYSSLIPREGAVSFPVQVRTLDWFLDGWGVSQLDLLCVDVEGTEDKVVMGLNLAKWKPKIVCLEDWSNTNRHGHLLPGYELIHVVNQLDHIYLRKE